VFALSLDLLPIMLPCHFLNPLLISFGKGLYPFLQLKVFLFVECELGLLSLEHKLLLSVHLQSMVHLLTVVLDCAVLFYHHLQLFFKLQVPFLDFAIVFFQVIFLQFYTVDFPTESL
jgi:hypothetical protein